MNKQPVKLANKPESALIRFTMRELELLLAAVDETLHEGVQGYSKADLARLVGIHSRMCISYGLKSREYALRGGSVVSAINTNCFITQPSDVPWPKEPVAVPVRLVVLCCRQGRFAGAYFDRVLWHWRIPFPVRLAPRENPKLR